MAKTTVQADLLPVKDLVRLLNIASGNPLPCVIGISGGKDEALLLIDKRIKGKKLAERVRREHADRIEPKTVRFGEVGVSADGQTVALRLNKAPVAGTPLLLTKIVKRAGYAVVTFEEDENVGGEEDGAPDVGADPAAGSPADIAPEPVAPAPSAAPETATETPAAAGDTGTGLAPGQVEALARRIKPAVAASPALGRPIAEAWRALQTAVAAKGDAREPAAALLRLLDQAENAAPAAAPAADRTQEVVARANDIWQKSSDRLRQTLDRLKGSMLDAYGDNPAAQKAIRDRLGSVDEAFAWMDDRLTRKLADVRASTDPAERRALAREGVAIAADYVDRVKGNAMLRELDGNPFGVDTRFGDTIDKVLPAVTKLMQAVA